MIPNFGAVVRRSFTRSGQPKCSEFPKIKAKVILKLTTNEEYPDASEGICSGGRACFFDIPGMSAQVDFDLAEKTARKVQHLIKKGTWVHIHCHLGRDRTGLVVGIWRLRFNHDSMKKVKADWVKYGIPFNSYRMYLEKIGKEIHDKSKRQT